MIVYIGTLLLLNIPFVQQKMSVFVAGKLSSHLKTDVKIRRINVGLLNRIIIDDLLLNDRSEKEMLKVTRLSAKFDILPLLRGKISIGSVQLFGFNISLNKETPEADPNFKFVIDAFASKDTVSTQKDLDLRINSLLVRRGKFAYDILSEKETPGKFNPRHIKLYNIIGNISLKALQKDSINAQIKRLSMDDQSGLELQRLSLKILGNDNSMRIENFAIDLPSTSLQMDTMLLDYDSLGCFNNFMKDVHFSFRMLPSHITPFDLSPLIPAFGNFNEKIDIEVEANGSIDQLNCQRLSVKAGRNLQLMGNVSFQDLSQPSDAFIYGKLSNLSANEAGVDFLVRNFSKEYEQTPDILRRMGNISFNGEISGYFNDLVTYGVFRTDLGEISSDLKLSSDKEKNLLLYSGGIKTEEFELGKALNNSKLDKVSLNFDVAATHHKGKYPDATLKGLISSIGYSGYTYSNITMDGVYSQGGFDGEISLNDEHGAVFLNGSFNLSEKVPTFNFIADIDDLYPHRLNLVSDKYKGASFSTKLTANFSGGSPEEMVGSINVDSFLFVSPEKQYYLENFNVLSTRTTDNKKRLSVQSEFINGVVEGTYSYRTLPTSFVNAARQYVPSLFPEDKKGRYKTADNNFTFDIDIYNTNILTDVFQIPLKVFSKAELKGSVNDQSKRVDIFGNFPQIQYNNTFIESGTLICQNRTDHLETAIRLNSHRKNNVATLSLKLQAKDDKLDGQIFWGNSGMNTYSGSLKALAGFSRDEEKSNSPLKAVIDISRTDVLLNDTAWSIHPSQVIIDSKKVYINNFNFSHEDQYLHINGCASNSIKDSVIVDMKGINIEYVFDIFNFRSVDFKGMTTGSAIACRVLDKPVMNTNLTVDNFHFNNALMGDMKVYGEWRQQEEGIWLKADIKEKEISQTNVEGYIFPLKPKSGLDLHIGTTKGNIKFLETYVGSIMSNVSGRASGKVRLHGEFKNLNIEGSAFADADFKINILNTAFHFKDSVRILPGEVLFDNITVYDPEGHRGTVNGYLRHQHFRDMNYRFELNAENTLIMKTDEDPDVPFYGTIYATGNARLTGDNRALNLNAAVSTNRNSNFVYIMTPIASATSNQFINFVDKTPNRMHPDSLNLISEFEQARLKQKKEEEELDLDIRMNIQVDATPEGTVKIIMDPIAGDYISGKGNGNIRLDYFNKGDVKMFGSYTINQGIYKFSLQEVIRKDFIISDGSSITFNGDPMAANLNIRAVYTVNSASLNDLLPAEEIAAINPSNINVRANCLMDITGMLTKPMIKMDLELPHERDEVQAMVKNYVSTEEDINMQILYLLGIGKFYPPEHLNVSQNSNVMSSVLSSTLSGQLNNLLSQIINNNNWNFGTSLSTGDKGWTDMEIQGILSGQLLNNRLLINGNFGYRDSPLATTNFVGDFEAEWLLTRSGDIRLKAYNQTNDRYYIRTNLTTQGIGIMYKKEFDRWNELFFWNNWRRKKKETEIQPAESTLQTDTIPAIQPDSIR